MNKQDTIDCAPEPLHAFLIYLESILGRSPKTVDEYFYSLRTFYRFLCIHFKLDDKSDFKNIDISKVDIDILRKVDLGTLYEYANFLNRTLGNKARTRARKISALKSYFKYLHSKVKLIEENPTTDLDSIKIEDRLPKYFTLDESIDLLESIDERNFERDYCILVLFLNCGMRLAELVNINITDIHGDSLTVIGKGNKERTIYLNDACLDAIDAYMQVRQKITPEYSDKNALFLSERRRRISRRTVQYTVEKYVKKLGLDPHKYTTHKLRHTAATLMHRSGVDIRVLQEILGHKQLSTTEIYTHISSDEMKNAIARNPLAHVKSENHSDEK